MKKGIFEPKMSGGELSPEAHAEWADKGGKHVTNGLHKEAKPSLEGKGGEIGFGGKGQSGKKGASLDSHEARSVEKGKGGKGGSPFPGTPNSGGFPTGPMKHAGAHMGKIPADGGIRSDTPMPKAKPELPSKLGNFKGSAESGKGPQESKFKKNRG